jgi:hypothetical protein
MPEAKAFERLPKIITPVNYNIRLKPNLKVFTFEGSEDIDIEVMYPRVLYRKEKPEICEMGWKWNDADGLINTVDFIYLRRFRLAKEEGFIQCSLLICLKYIKWPD